MLFIVTNASSMLIVFTKFNDLWLYLLCFSRRGLLKNVLNCCMRISVQFNNLRKTWRLKKCCSRLIWSIEIYNLLKEQLKINLGCICVMCGEEPSSQSVTHPFTFILCFCQFCNLFKFNLLIVKTKPPIIKLYYLIRFHCF